MNRFILILMFLMMAGCTHLETQQRAARQSTSNTICYDIIVTANTIVNETHRYCLTYIGRIQ